MARGRGISVNALMVEALEGEIERVRSDNDFMSRLRELTERGREILDLLGERHQWLPLLHAQVGIGDWKQAYNQNHRHSSLAYQTPNEYAQTCAPTHRLQ